MSLYTLPKSYNSCFKAPKENPACPVDIDDKNELNNGTQALYVAESGNVNFRSSKGLIGTTVSSGNIGFFPNTNGMSISATVGNTSLLTNDNVKAPGTGDFTFFSQVRITSVSGVFNYIIALDGSTGIAIHNSNVFYHFLGSSLLGTTTPVAGRTYTVVATRRNGTRYLYVDGIEENSGASTENVTDRQLRLLSYNGSFSAARGRDVMLAGYSTKGWTEAQVKSFNNNPFQLLKPRDNTVYFVPEATLTGAIPVIMHSYRQRRV